MNVNCEKWKRPHRSRHLGETRSFFCEGPVLWDSGVQAPPLPSQSVMRVFGTALRWMYVNQNLCKMKRKQGRFLARLGLQRSWGGWDFRCRPHFLCSNPTRVTCALLVGVTSVSVGGFPPVVIWFSRVVDHFIFCFFGFWFWRWWRRLERTFPA